MLVLANDKVATVENSEGFNPIRFMNEVVAEMKKVSWCTREELVIDTGVVALAVVIVCTLIWVCDTTFARLFELILK